MPMGSKAAADLGQVCTGHNVARDRAEHSKLFDDFCLLLGDPRQDPLWS